MIQISAPLTCVAVLPPSPHVLSVYLIENLNPKTVFKAQLRGHQSN